MKPLIEARKTYIGAIDGDPENKYRSFQICISSPKGELKMPLEALKELAAKFPYHKPYIKRCIRKDSVTDTKLLYMFLVFEPIASED